MTASLVIGGAGFVGSHLVRRLLARPETAAVTVYDNFSSGEEWHLEPVAGDKRLKVVRKDAKDLKPLTKAAKGHDVAFLLASNPNIARALREPAIDFWEGTYLVQNAAEACRVAGVPRLVYASGSGVYGDQGARDVDEALGPLLPVSTYGASKLAGEALISSYCHLFGLRGVAFRFANIVGPRQTHGVVHDFIRKLLADPTRLEVLGDGSQSKSYLHVDDALDALLMLADDPPEVFDVFNAATEDYVTVREIAELVITVMGLEKVAVAFGDTPGGWKGDVPVVRFSSEKLRARGWANRRSSRAALADAARSMHAEARKAAV
jgi:UDP-glucose 4-epimerase